jgi:hypothetical protein
VNGLDKEFREASTILWMDTWLENEGWKKSEERATTTEQNAGVNWNWSLFSFWLGGGGEKRLLALGNGWRGKMSQGTSQSQNAG